MKHFRFSGGGYVLGGKLEAIHQEMEAGRYKQLEDVEKAEDIYLSTAEVKMLAVSQPTPPLCVGF